MRDKTAPRPPHSGKKASKTILLFLNITKIYLIHFHFVGYIRFLNDRREQFRAENPNLPFAEITKVLAAEWNQLPADKKQVNHTILYLIVSF